MTNQAAIDILNAFRVGCGSDVINQALDMAIAALEKQEPMEPKDKYSFGHGFIGGQCPVCGANMYDDEVYCDECGQHLEWKDDTNES